jgi:hypothetical protein
MARTGSFLTVRLTDPHETKDSLSTAPPVLSFALLSLASLSFASLRSIILAAPRVCHLENMSLLAGVEPPEGYRTFDPSREDGNQAQA